MAVRPGPPPPLLSKIPGSAHVHAGKFSQKGSLMYGSLYVTLCFVLCRFYFGVLTFYFRVLSFLFMRSVYDLVHFKRRNSRGRDKI